MTRRALLVPLFAAAFVLVPAELAGRKASSSRQETVAQQTPDGHRTTPRSAALPVGPGGLAG